MLLQPFAPCSASAGEDFRVRAEGQEVPPDGWYQENGDENEPGLHSEGQGARCGGQGGRCEGLSGRLVVGKLPVGAQT